MSAGKLCVCITTVNLLLAGSGCTAKPTQTRGILGFDVTSINAMGPYFVLASRVSS